MEGIVSLLPLVAIALLFWLLIIRPASKRQKDQARMQSAVTVGEQVMLTSGIFGTVTDMDDDKLSLEIAPGVVVSVARGAVGSVVRRHEPDEERAEEPTEGDADSETN
ncbi:MAG TPA: preprotein translocase subunit YajC [Nocardioides sp.]|nr:preprotein translocase subunit YajC [Nocardioides sp.]